MFKAGDTCEDFVDEMNNHDPKEETDDFIGDRILNEVYQVE